MRALVVFVFALFGTLVSAQEAPFTLASSFSADSSIGEQLVSEWIGRVAEATEGRVKIEFNGGQSPDQSITGLTDGTFDFAFFRDSADPGPLAVGHPMVQFVETLSIGAKDTGELNLRLCKLLDPFIKYDFDTYNVLFLTFDSGNGITIPESMGFTSFSDLAGGISATCIDSRMNFDVTQALGFEVFFCKTLLSGPLVQAPLI